jgi:hypothetical protein
MRRWILCLESFIYKLVVLVFIVLPSNVMQYAPDRRRCTIHFDCDVSEVESMVVKYANLGTVASGQMDSRLSRLSDQGSELEIRKRRKEEPQEELYYTLEHRMLSDW